MKQKIKDLILNAITAAHQQGALPSSNFPQIEAEEPKLEAHGDFSTNIAMAIASVQKMPPGRLQRLLLNILMIKIRYLPKQR